MPILLNSTPTYLGDTILELNEQLKTINLSYSKIMATRLYNYLQNNYIRQEITIDIYSDRNDEYSKRIIGSIDGERDDIFTEDLESYFCNQIYECVGENQITFKNNEKGRKEMLAFFIPNQFEHKKWMAENLANKLESNLPAKSSKVVKKQKV